MVSYCLFKAFAGVSQFLSSFFSVARVSSVLLLHCSIRLLSLRPSGITCTTNHKQKLTTRTYRYCSGFCAPYQTHVSRHISSDPPVKYFSLKRDCNLGEAICSISGTVMSWTACDPAGGYRSFKRTSCISLYFCPENRGGRFVRNCRAMYLLQKF